MLRKAEGTRDSWETGDLSSTHKICNPLTWLKPRRAAMTPHTPWESRTVRAAALTNCRKVSLLVSVVCDLQGHVHEASPMLRSHKVYNVKGVMSL